MTPTQALENLVNLADNAMLNGPDRRTVNESVQALQVLILDRNSMKEPSAAKPDTAPAK